MLVIHFDNCLAVSILLLIILSNIVKFIFLVLYMSIDIDWDFHYTYISFFKLFYFSSSFAIRFSFFTSKILVNNSQFSFTVASPGWFYLEYIFC